MYLCFCLGTSVTKVRFGDQFQALESVQIHPQEKGIKKITARMREDKKSPPFSFFPLHIRKTLTRYVHVSLFSFKYRRNLGGLNSAGMDSEYIRKFDTMKTN